MAVCEVIREQDQGDGIWQEYQQVDLPDSVDERQAEHERRPRKVEGNQERPARYPMRDPANGGGDPHIGHHLERERGAENGPGMAVCEVIREQDQGDGRKTGAREGDNLRSEQAAIGGVGERRKHGYEAFASGHWVTPPIHADFDGRASRGRARATRWRLPGRLSPPKGRRVYPRRRACWP